MAFQEIGREFDIKVDPYRFRSDDNKNQNSWIPRNRTFEVLSEEVADKKTKQQM
jgi:hypothetical protein